MKILSFIDIPQFFRFLEKQKRTQTEIQVSEEFVNNMIGCCASTEDLSKEVTYKSSRSGLSVLGRKVSG